MIISFDECTVCYEVPGFPKEAENMSDVRLNFSLSSWRPQVYVTKLWSAFLTSILNPSAAIFHIAIIMSFASNVLGNV